MPHNSVCAITQIRLQPSLPKASPPVALLTAARCFRSGHLHQRTFEDLFLEAITARALGKSDHINLSAREKPLRRLIEKQQAHVLGPPCYVHLPMCCLSPAKRPASTAWTKSSICATGYSGHRTALWPLSSKILVRSCTSPGKPARSKSAILVLTSLQLGVDLAGFFSLL